MYRIAPLIFVLALVAAGCSGGGSADTPTTEGATTTTTATTIGATTTTTAAVTTTTTSQSGPDDRPATGVSAIMGNDPATELYYARATGEYDVAVMGIEPGTVTAEWFRAEGFFVVFYNGVDTTATGPMCPGASIATAAGFDFISNAATEGADCSGIVVTEATQDGVRALQCGNALAYRTAIPEDSAGVLFGTLEKSVGEGIMGITSLAESAAGDIPEVDISLFEC